MSKLDSLEGLKEDSFSLVPESGGRLVFKGVIAMRDPSAVVGGYLKRVHAAAVADRVERVTLDVTGLEFMNSSAIRMFIDWVEWIGADGHQYRLHCVTNARVTWQRSTFSALRSLSPLVVIESKAAN
jgi:hypothetical protein